MTKVGNQLDRNQKLYDFLKSKTWQLTERWYESLNKDQNGIYGTTNLEEIQLLKQQNHLFHEKFVEMFNNSDEVCEKSFDDFITMVVNDEGHQHTPLTEIIGEFFRQQQLYLELLEEFMDQYPNELSSKQIIAYTNAILTTINNVVLKFTNEFIEQSKIRLKSQQEMIIELSAPVIKLDSTIALLPLVGEIDTNRAKVILESTLQQCSKLQINHLYIDLLGVPIVDTMVAHQLFHMINALKLIGVSTSLSGVRPSIAQTTVQLGIDFSDIKTYSSIEQAMRKHNNN